MENDLYKKLATLHMEEVSHQDISYKLGISATEKFYQLLISGQYGDVLYHKNSNGEIIACVIAFTKYKEFAKKLRLRLISEVLKCLISHRIRLHEVVTFLLQKAPDDIKAIEDFHAGFVVRSSRHLPESALALSALYLKSLQIYRKKGIYKVWGVTTIDNIQGRKIIAANKSREIIIGNMVYSIVNT